MSGARTWNVPTPLGESFFIQHRKVRLSISPSDHMCVLPLNKVSIGVKKAETISYHHLCIRITTHTPANEIARWLRSPQLQMSRLAPHVTNERYSIESTSEKLQVSASPRNQKSLPSIGGAVLCSIYRVDIAAASQNSYWPRGIVHPSDVVEHYWSFPLLQSIIMVTARWR